MTMYVEIAWYSRYRTAVSVSNAVKIPFNHPYEFILILMKETSEPGNTTHPYINCH